MTPAEEQELLQFAIDLASADRSEWEPRCVAEAFARPVPDVRQGPEFVLTLQGWIDLDAIRSPILQGRLPEAATAREDLLAAMACFDRVPEVECTPENAVEIGHRMIAAVHDAFAMIVKMQPPKGSELGERDGSPFGLWLPVFCGIMEIVHDTRKAFAMPVTQAFALLAGTKGNHGWTVDGETYRTRECEMPEPSEEPSEEPSVKSVESI
jgi:hypothetical protein